MARQARASVDLLFGPISNIRGGGPSLTSFSSPAHPAESPEIKDLSQEKSGCFFFGDGDSSVHSGSSGAVLFAGVDGAPTDAPPRTERPDTALPSFEAVIDRGGVFVDEE